MKIITNAKINKGFQHWQMKFEENEPMRNKYRVKVLAYRHPQGNAEEICKVIETESKDKMQEMLK